MLLSYAFAGRVWTTLRGWVSLGMIAAGVVGTVLVLATPLFRTARAGMVWTFVLLSLLSATFYLRLLDRLGPRRMGTLLAMRVLALGALVPMLFEPVLRWSTKPEPERPVLFVVDTSGSMSFPDVQNGPTRIQNVWQTLQPLLPRVRQKLVPQYLTFATDVQELKKPEELASATADGRATDVVTAVKKAYAHTTRDDAVVVVLSDGIDNTSPNVADTLAALQRPVYTVLVGSDASEAAQLANIAVADVEADEDFAVGHESQVTAVVKSTALNDRVVDVKLAEIDAKGKPTGPVSSKKLVLQNAADGQKVKLDYKPGFAGVHKLAVWVDPVAGERSVVDNRQELQGLAIDPGIKVLYIEGRLRPEYKELTRLLSRDPNVELAALLRIQEARFVASGTNDRKPVTPRVPSTPAEWKKFDVVILGDLDSSFLSQPQQAQLEQFVADGGALLMLGGEKSFGPGGYKGTPIEKALPVFVGDLRSPLETGRFVPRLTTKARPTPPWKASPPGSAARTSRARSNCPSCLATRWSARRRAGASPAGAQGSPRPGRQAADRAGGPAVRQGQVGRPHAA